MGEIFDQAVNRELTELLGECWHKTELYGDSIHIPLERACVKCGNTTAEEGVDSSNYLNNNDFFTNEGYGKVRDIYDGWDEGQRYRFKMFVCAATGKRNTGPDDLLHAFHRDNLAPLMLKFLKQEAEDENN